MDDPWNEDHYGHIEDYDDLDTFEQPPLRKQNRERARGKRTRMGDKPKRKNREERHVRVESRDGTFRCRHCKTVVGKPISGGRHRNHCPLCLYSRHVDLKTPGDRSSICRSLMQAVGLFTRRDGEQVLVHECLGCKVIRHNRVAADDNVVATMRLPVVTTTETDKAGDSDVIERTA